MEILNIKKYQLDDIINNHFDFDLQVKNGGYFINGKKIKNKKKDKIILSILSYLKDRGYIVKVPNKNSYNFYFFDDIDADSSAIKYAKHCPKGSIVFTDREGAYVDGVKVLKTEFNNMGDCAIIFENK